MSWVKVVWSVAARPATVRPALAAVIRKPSGTRMISVSGPGRSPGCFWIVRR